MEVKVATGYVNWSQPSVSRSPSPQTLASAISSPSSRRRCVNDVTFVFRCVNNVERSTVFGTKLYRSRSMDQLKPKQRTLKRACSASFDSFSEEEFSKQIQELALRFQLSDEDDEENARSEADSIKQESEVVSDTGDTFAKMEPTKSPEWCGEIIPASVERKANSVELPLSLRTIKRKKQWQEGFREAGESAYCSVKKAFSSMVFIIRELHSYTLQMREVLFYEDLQGILVRVQNEMNASFVWLFQQVFSHTPTLMVYVMILLANYSVYSMGSSAAIAAPPPSQAFATTAESVLTTENQNHRGSKFDSSAIKTFSVSSGGRTTSIGGINGGGGTFRPVASGTDGDGHGRASADLHWKFLPDGFSSVGNHCEDSGSGLLTQEQEVILWNSLVEEAREMQADTRDEALDSETMQRMVSPVTAKMEEDNYSDYVRTELLYQMGLAQEPNNPLLLSNYAQFLYLVAHDYDRAEDYFKRAAMAEQKDAEALSKYATFLWHAKKDLWAAEETYLEAIAVDPTNSHYASNYAHFLWNTGGEDTCFPLSPPDNNPQEL